MTTLQRNADIPGDVLWCAEAPAKTQQGRLAGSILKKIKSINNIL